MLVLTNLPLHQRAAWNWPGQLGEENVANSPVILQPTSGQLMPAGIFAAKISTRLEMASNTENNVAGIRDRKGRESRGMLHSMLRQRTKWFLHTSTPGEAELWYPSPLPPERIPNLVSDQAHVSDITQIKEKRAPKITYRFLCSRSATTLHPSHEAGGSIYN